MNNISAFGLSGRVIASSTFPSGFVVEAFADDADPLDIPAITLAETAMGLNGDLIVWSSPHPIEIVLNVIPNSVDDENFQILAEANRIGKAKQSARDAITIALSYPDGTIATLSAGVIVTAIVGQPVSNTGRLKTKPYTFRFSNITKAK